MEKSQREAADVVLACFCALATTFLILGTASPLQRQGMRVSLPALVDQNEPLISGTGFALNAIFPATIPPPESWLKLYGSWLGTNDSTGSVHTAWYRAVPVFHIYVAGYTNHPGNNLLTEVVTRTSQVVRIPISPDENAGQSWFLKRVSLQQVQDPVKFRIVAVDGSSGWGGWLGFSEPFLACANNPYLWRQWLLVTLATAASLFIYISPGLLVRQKLRERMSFVFIPVPGLVGVGLLGLAAWLGPRQLSSRRISQLTLALLVIYAIYQFIRVPLSSYTTRIERRVLLIAMVLAAIGVAKATYSLGPVGELFGNTISRTIEIGGRSDSRLGYHAVQLVAMRSRPFSALGKFLYSSYGVWNFSHRGALPALAASPIVLASPVRVPPVMPDQPWAIFDPEGFSAYRIAMIAIACCSLLAAFGLARLFLPEEWALLAYLVTVTAPFVIHEIYFTWPKLESAGFVLIAAYLALRSRYFLSGLALGTGYLCHPLALLSTPALMALVILKPKACAQVTVSVRVKLYRWTLGTALILAGIGMCILLWKHVNGKHFAQGEFLSFALQSDGRPWLAERFDSLCNTLLPLYLFAFNSTHRDVNVVGGLSPATIQFYFQYWDGVPFGAGIAYFCCLLRLLWLGFLKARAWLLFIVGIPFLFFTLYWGGSSSGMLREGLHPWFLGLLIFSVVLWKKFESHSQRFWKICNWALLSRAVEIPLMLLLPTVWPRHTLVQDTYAVSDSLALLIMVTGAVGVCVYMFVRAEDLRKHAL